MNTRIQTPTPNLEDSLNFYKQLGFTVVSDKNPILVSDGTVLIEINPNRFARAGIKLFDENWTLVLEQFKNVAPMANGHLLSDPSGTWIYLMEADQGTKLDRQIFPKSVLGNSMGVSLESIAFKDSITFYEKLGFKKEEGNLSQGWTSLKNKDGLIVTIMKDNACPHLFFNPSLTYFNGAKNEKVIETIRSSEIPITEEITYFNSEGAVDNIIIRDPGGLGFFIFND